jgi:NTE family protein
MEVHQKQKQNNDKTDLKIGLALSGGGFRASIFHLGVIRRLEELGIMKDVSVISAVSGGSIIAAYYLVEMENRLRQKRKELKDKTINEIRLEIFESIAEDFFKALDHNLRTRAIVFWPFYHPIAFFKCILFKKKTNKYNRSYLIQKEYDHWFYHGYTMGQLPSVIKGRKKDQIQTPGFIEAPKLVINTASLLTGKRVGFSRVPISGISEMSLVNKNVLPLSRVVGASSCVPGLFPPVTILGDLLVDGGVCDNQGLDVFIESDLVDSSVNKQEMKNEDLCEQLEKEVDVLIVSDASGQLEPTNNQSSQASSVLARCFSIQSFQIRNRLLKLLIKWKEEIVKSKNSNPENISKKNKDDTKKGHREFAFVHLYLNLKDRIDKQTLKEVHRVPSEYIEELGKIRTDLDQFSPIERECLMYHGYTLIDAQINEYCEKTLKKKYCSSTTKDLKCSPLFSEENIKNQSDEKNTECNVLRRRKTIKKILESGSNNIFLLRSIIRYPFKASPVIALNLLLSFAVIYLGSIYKHLKSLIAEYLVNYMIKWLDDCIPSFLKAIFTNHVDFFRWPINSDGVASLLTMFIIGYLLLFSTYLLMRWFIKYMDLLQYEDLTGKSPSTNW